MPGQIPCTPMPLVDCVCHRDTGGHRERTRRGEYFLLYLLGCSHSDTEQRELFSGVGAYICIGGALTESAWAIVTGSLCRRRERFSARVVCHRDLDVALPPSDRDTIEIINRRQTRRNIACTQFVLLGKQGDVSIETAMSVDQCR